MLQEILPKKYISDFSKDVPKAEDFIIIPSGREFLMIKSGDNYLFPRFKEISESGRKLLEGKLVRTIAVDNEAFFVNMGEYSEEIAEEISGAVELVSNEILRHYFPMYVAFAASTAMQIYRWMKSNQYCGRCGSPMRRDENERAMKCDCCKNMVFPKICPAVTISIIKDDKILLVRNKSGVFHRYAQVAGYVEIGETFEDTVRREAMEETGITINHVTYYKNQPWGMTDAQMIGYIADITGSTDIKIQESEIIEARWFGADEIPPDIADRSLTYEMIGKFRKEHIDKTGETGKWKEFYDLFDIGK